jgi:hypothetical protein
MSSDVKSNLEPIEETDLNLKSKFLENSEKSAAEMVDNKAKTLEFKEEKLEKKEGAVEKEAAYSKILSKVKTTATSADKSISDDAKSTNAEKNAESKIEKLVQLAMQKGVIHAVKVARHLDNNYVLDEFHDRLMVEELHDALIKRGLIREL